MAANSTPAAISRGDRQGFDYRGHMTHHFHRDKGIGGGDERFQFTPQRWRCEMAALSPWGIWPRSIFVTMARAPAELLP